MAKLPPDPNWRVRLTLRDLGGPSPANVRLRRLLKYTLRYYGFAASIESVPPPAVPQEKK